MHTLHRSAQAFGRSGLIRHGRCFSAVAQSTITSAQQLKVLFGSQTGVAHGFAMQLANHLEELPPSSAGGLSVSCCDLYDYSGESDLTLSRLAGEKALVFVVSCFGRGEPTDSAKSFMSWLNDPARDSEGSLKGLTYTVFGLGSSQTHKAYYNVVGKQLDARLEALGATRMYSRGEGDAGGPSIEMDFEAWEKGFLETMGKGAEPLSAETALGSTPSSPPSPARTVAMQAQAGNPYHSETDCPIAIHPAAAPCDLPMKQSTPTAAAAPVLYVPPLFIPLSVRSLVNLTPMEGVRPIYEVRLQGSAGEGEQHKTGDHVAVQPSNSAQAVQRLCARMRWDPSFAFTVHAHGSTPAAVAKGEGIVAKLPFQGVVTVGQVLRDYLAIGGPVSPALIRTLASHASSASDRDGLIALAEKESYLGRIKEGYVQLVDLLDSFPTVSLPLDRYLTLAAPLMPRYYSISSSPAMHGSGEVHVTFRHLRVPRATGALAKGPTFDGACSTHMASLRSGDTVAMRVRPSSFTLPVDPLVPIIMIAGGIGIAPFKAFLEDRMAGAGRGVTYGPSMLLYGCRDGRDEVYRSLAQQAIAVRALSTLDIGHAVPLPGSGKQPTFADALVMQHADEVWQCLQNKGTVYVCGGASGFGSAVAGAVKRVVAQRLPPGAVQDAEVYMDKLLGENRFLEDLAD